MCVCVCVCVCVCSVYIYIMEYYSALIKEGNPAISNNMNEPEGTILSEVSQTEKDK